MGSILIPGSFDPMTLGHLDVVRRVSARFERVYVAVMTNDMPRYVEGAAEKQYMFTMAERRRIAELTCEGLGNVEVITAGGRLIDLVDTLGVDWIIKGVRNEIDFAYEQQHAQYNRAHNHRAETLYLPADPSLDGISSTAARERILAGEDLSEYLSFAVIDWLKENKKIKGENKNGNCK